MMTEYKRKIDKSEMTRGEYLSLYVFGCGLLSLYAYGVFSLVDLNIHGYPPYLRAVFCLVVASLCGLALTYKTERNTMNFLCSMCLGVGGYAIMAASSKVPKIVWIILYIIAGYTLLRFLLTMCGRIRNKEHRWDIIKRRLFRSMKMVWNTSVWRMPLCHP